MSSSASSSKKTDFGVSDGNPSKAKPPAEAPEHRPVFLLCYPSAKFKAHWAIFVPNIDDKSVRKGKLIHVTGDVRNGFRLEFKRNYDLQYTRNPPRPPIELGLAPTAFLVDTIGDGRNTADSEPQDAFEDMVSSVPAPAKSLNSASEGSSKSGPPKRAQLSDCQWWVARCVEMLVESGYLIAPIRGRDKGRSPVEILAAAPKH